MKAKHFLPVLLTLIVIASPALAGEPLSIRLVKASNEGTEISLGLDDVVPVLQKNFVFKSYKLMGAGVMSLPTMKRTLKLSKYIVKCTGEKSNLTIVVEKSGKKLIKTNVQLRNGKPLIVGGFPGGGGTMILVFLVQ